MFKAQVELSKGIFYAFSRFNICVQFKNVYMKESKPNIPKKKNQKQKKLRFTLQKAKNKTR